MEKEETVLNMPRIREHTPERDVSNSQEVVRLPAQRMTRRQIFEAISKNKLLLTYASIILVAVITLSVLFFCISEVVIITKDVSLSSTEKMTHVNIFLNIIIFILGVFIPGPFHNLKLKRKK